MRRVSWVWLLVVLLLSTPAWAFRVATGTYTGNGVDARNITVTPSFTISLVLLKGNNAQPAVFSHTELGADTTAQFAVNGAFLADCIQSMGVGIFQVGTAGQCNADTIAYHYLAFGTDGQNDLAFETYTGTAPTDNVNITTVPAFTPQFCTLSGNNTGVGLRPWLTTVMGTNNACGWTNAACQGNVIQQFNADGFQVGSGISANAAGVTYGYFCLRSGVVAVSHGTYTTGTTPADDRVISGVGFTPLFVLVKQDGTQNAAFRFTTMAGDSSFVGATSATTDAIQAMASDTFTVGLHAAVQTASNTFYWLAVGEQPATTQRRGRVLWLD